MSLRDQLVKSGLVSKEKAKKVEREKGRKRHQAHRDREVRAALEREKRAQQEAIAAEDERKRHADRERNRKIEERTLHNQLRGEARVLIDQKRITIPKEAENRFNFTSDGRKIRSLLVTDELSRRLSEGELAICRNDRDGYDFPLLPVGDAERLLEIEKITGERWVYFLVDPEEVSDADDEWAAWDAYEASLKEDS